MADVHAVLLRLQVLVVALVLVLAVVRRGVAGERRGGGHGRRPGVPEPRRLETRISRRRKRRNKKKMTKEKNEKKKEKEKEKN